MKTNRLVRLAFAVSLAAVLAGCRQSDGPLPMPEGEQLNKTGDISRDLLSVAAKADGAVNDLTDDLANISSLAPPLPMVRDMARALDGALAGKSPSPEATQQLAETVFVALAARELSESQIETLTTEVGDRVRKAGGDEAGASAVAAAAARIQAEITNNPRRWYHFF
jgi:hypothetical protein